MHNAIETQAAQFASAFRAAYGRKPRSGIAGWAKAAAAAAGYSGANAAAFARALRAALRQPSANPAPPRTRKGRGFPGRRSS